MNWLIRNAAIAFMVVTVTVTTGYARNDYMPQEDVNLEEVSTDRDTLAAGAVVPYLPNGTRSIIIQRTQYFISGGNWFQPIILDGGIRYRVVFAPI